MGAIERFQALLAAGRESAMLRLALGTELLKCEDAESAIPHLERAVELESDYSAAWQHLGRALELAGRTEDAARAWRRGIEAAEGRGDVQVAKVMRVWLRRLERRAGAESSEGKNRS